MSVDEESLLRLYALAMAWIPEQEAATDSFIEAKEENDLYRRAAAWRALHGLPPPERHLVLPDLDGPSRDDALHLAERKRRRNRTRLRAKRAAIGAAFLVALVTLSWSLMPSANAVNQIFRQDPVAVSDTADGYHFEIIQVDATPDTMTLWWSVVGPDITSLSRGVEPSLQLASSQLIYPSATEVRISERTRLLGTSTYQAIAPSLEPVTVRVDRLGDRTVSWSLQAPLTRKEEDPSARRIVVDHRALYWQHWLTVRSVMWNYNYTAVHFRVEGPIDQAMGAQLIGISTGQQWLAWKGTWPIKSGAQTYEGVAIFGPAPAGTGSIRVHFSPSGFRQYTLALRPGNDGMVSMSPWVQDSTTWEAQLELVREGISLVGPVVVLGNGSERFPAILMPRDDRHFTVRAWETHPGFVPRALEVEVTSFSPGPPLDLTLPGAQG